MYKISNNSEVVIFLLGEMRWNDSYVHEHTIFQITATCMCYLLLFILVSIFSMNDRKGLLLVVITKFSGICYFKFDFHILSLVYIYKIQTSFVHE